MCHTVLPIPTTEHSDYYLLPSALSLVLPGLQAFLLYRQPISQTDGTNIPTDGSIASRQYVYSGGHGRRECRHDYTGNDVLLSSCPVCLLPRLMSLDADEIPQGWDIASQ